MTQLIIEYLVCSILSYGIIFGYYQHKWPSLAKEEYKPDLSFAISRSILGPLSLFCAIINCEFIKYGLKFK